MIKAIIFDMDGVLFDSQPLHFEAERVTSDRFGHAMTDAELKEYLGWTEEAFWDIVIKKFKFKTTVAKMQEIKKPIYEKLVREKLHKDEELMALLDKLRKQGLKLAVASSSPMNWINMILTGLGVRDKFDAVISGEGMPSKPAPVIFLKAAKAIEVPADYCIVVEDAPAGIKAAKSAGMHPVALLNKSNEGLDFSNVKTIRKLSEVLELSKQL